MDPITQANFVDSLLYSVGVLSEAGRSTTSAMQNEALIRMLNGRYAEAGDYINWIDDKEVSQKYFGGMYTSNYRYY